MKNRKKLVVGNWKMNIMNVADAKKLVSGVKRKTAKIRKTEVVFCPPFVYLADLKNLVGKNIKQNHKLGVQNISQEEKGALTGEVSAAQVRQYGVTYAIVGHSERRKMGETDEMVNKKVQLALQYKMTPILCIGEALHDENGDYLQFIKNQLKLALRGITNSQISDIVIAYEPIWAIGAKDAMQSRDIHAMTLYIKKCLQDMFQSYASPVKILYGGAVNVSNTAEIVSDGFVDGLLVGRDSLEIENFAQIIQAVESVK
jgi:triosephosphate isomerase